MIEGSGSASGSESGSGSIPLPDGSGSRRPKTCGSGGSGSGTLIKTYPYLVFSVFFVFSFARSGSDTFSEEGSGSTRSESCSKTTKYLRFVEIFKPDIF
jgi:hypothetical protein